MAGKQLPIGLVIELKKYGFNKVGNSQKQGGNSGHVMGHYDVVTMSPVKKWLNYSPTYLGNGSSIPNELQDISHYPIRLVFPESTQIDEMPSDFSKSYAEWADPEQILNSAPCATLILLNLTDKYKAAVANSKKADEKAESNGLHEKQDLLLNVIGEIQKNCSSLKLSDTHICVMPSMGYSDFCILLADQGWKQALELIECLHTLHIEYQGGSVPVLSTDYFIPIYHGDLHSINPSCFENLELSIRVNLAAGYTAQELANAVPRNVKVYRTSGSTDCLLYANCEETAGELFRFLMSPGCEDTQISESVGSNYVVDMVSTVHAVVQKNDSRHRQKEKNIKEDHKLELNEFYAAVKKYGEFSKDCNRHQRQVHFLREIGANIENLCFRQHTEKLRKIIQDFLQAFSYCLEQCAEQGGALKQKFEGNQSQSLDFPWEEVEGNIQELANRVSSFMADLSRADSAFMELEKYNHPSVSSATSLLLAYNQWINRFIREIQSVTLPENKSKYEVLVTSGGCDCTQTFEPFSFLEPEIEDGLLYEKVPLIIQMSEMSLFDFSGTILRAAHECMHVGGQRYREKRVLHYIKFISRIYGEVLATNLFSEERYLDIYVKAIKQNTALSNKPKKANRIIEKLRREYRSQWEVFASSIAAFLVGNLNTEKIDTWLKNQYLMRHLNQYIYKGLWVLFSDQSDPEKDLFSNLYKEQLKTVAKYCENCDRIFWNEKIRTVRLSIEAETAQVYLRQLDHGGKEDLDLELWEGIRDIISCFRSRNPSWDIGEGSNWGLHGTPGGEKEDERIPRRDDSELLACNISDILENATDCFRETFADVISCQVLGASLEDYVLMHIYEDWDLAESLDIQSFSNSYRFPIVLLLCFPESLNPGRDALTETARKKIQDAIERLEKHGMPKGRFQAEKVYGQIDELLTRYQQENRDIGHHLLEYLRICQEGYCKETDGGKLSGYKDFFKSIRLLSIDPDRLDTFDKLVKMYNSLLNEGEENCGN